MPLISRNKTSKIPAETEDKLRRGREVMLRDANKRRLYTKMERGDQYAYLSEKGALLYQDTVTHASGGGKPPHRVRNKYNFIRTVVQAKISAATQRVPSYEIVPTSTDPDKAAAAKLSEKVALYGHDKWMIRRAKKKAVKLALVQGEAFLYPHFDTSVGPFVDTLTDDGEIETVGQGEIKVLVFNGNQVYWEPGVDFYDSTWWAIERAMPISQAKTLPGYLGGELKADSTTADTATDRDKSADTVLVTELLERPSPANPDGARCMIANGRKIVRDERYPCEDEHGRIVDDPALIYLSYTVEPTEDRDSGLVEQIVDIQRTISDCWNRLVEWKNRCLNPQMMAPRGSDLTRRNDVPGATWYYNLIGGQKPEWEKPPAIPRELFEILQMSIEHLRALASDVDVQAEPDLAARTAQAAIEQSRLRWQDFIGDLAEMDSKLMRRCLQLVQRFYTEPRLLSIQGMFGPDLIEGFLGANLLGQDHVKVSPASLEVKSRKSVVEETMLFADRQWITPEAAMATIRGGVAEALGHSYELDVAKANEIIQTIKKGPEALFTMPTRFDPDVPNPDGTTGMDVPGWLPRRHIDNTQVWLQVWAMWLKTTDFDRMEVGMQEAAYQVFAALVDHKNQEDLEAAQQQQMMAEGLGMANAAAPQRAAPTPDQRMPALPD